MPMDDETRAKLDAARNAPHATAPAPSYGRYAGGGLPVRIGQPAMQYQQPPVTVEPFTGGEDTFTDVVVSVSVTGDMEGCWLIRSIIQQYARNAITATPQDGRGGEARLRFTASFHTER